MREVLDALNEVEALGQIGSRNQGNAAIAFGHLFSSLGTMMSYLPAPFNAYADFLSRCGAFFSDLHLMMNVDQAYDVRNHDREERRARALPVGFRP